MPPVPDPTDLVAFVEALHVDDVPTGLELAPGVTVDDPSLMLADLRRQVSETDPAFFLGVERAAQLRDALAARP